MGKIWSVLLLALVANGLLAAVACARPVYLADGGIVEAKSVWQENGRVYVLVNRDSLINFSPQEVNLKKTFAKKWKNPVRQPTKNVATPLSAAKVSAPPVASAAGKAASPTSPATPAAPAASGAKPQAAPQQPATPATVAPPKPAAPASATPAPAAKPAAKKPAPKPRPAAPAQPAETGGSAVAGMAVLGAALAFLLLILASFWKLFVKAGEAGWKSLVPIYNVFVLLKIAGCPLWWFLLLLIPVVNLWFAVVMHIRLAEKFGKGPLFGFGLCFLGFIFFPLLAFGSAAYEQGGAFTFEEEFAG